MKKTVALLITGLVLLSLFWSSPIISAQAPEEPDGDDGDGDTDSSPGTGELPGTGQMEPPENTTAGQGEQEEAQPFEIPMFVPVVIIIVIIVAVIALLVSRRRKSEEYIPEAPDLVPPPIEAGAPIFTPAV